MSTDLSKLLQVNPLFFSLSSVRELVDFYNSRGGGNLKWVGRELTAGAVRTREAQTSQRVFLISARTARHTYLSKT